VFYHVRKTGEVVSTDSPVSQAEDFIVINCPSEEVALECWKAYAEAIATDMLGAD
jgi:hypothetical protein